MFTHEWVTLVKQTQINLLGCFVCRGKVHSGHVLLGGLDQLTVIRQEEHGLIVFL